MSYDILESWMTRIFVYGTLKRNFSAHELINNGRSQFVAEATTDPRYHLHSIGEMRAFPGMVEGDGEPGGVRGEVYEVDDITLGVLDRYECVQQGLFERKEIELEDGTTALAYLFTGDDCMGMRRGRRIESGVWE